MREGGAKEGVVGGTKKDGRKGRGIWKSVMRERWGGGGGGGREKHVGTSAGGEEQKRRKRNK